MSVLTIVALSFGLLAVAFLWVAVTALRQRRLGRGLITFLTGLLALALAGLAAAVTIGVKGFRALTHEDRAARVRTEPIGPQRFRATVELPDGQSGQFEI